jgi:ELWxxDGT repeat protein
MTLFADPDRVGTKAMRRIQTSSFCIALLIVLGSALIALSPNKPAAAIRSTAVNGPATQIKDINTELYTSASSAPADFTAMGGMLYFRATDDPHGRELWKSDGTAAGTSLVKDIYPGQDSSIPAFPLNNEMVSLIRQLDLGCGFPIIRALALISDQVYFIDGDQADSCGLWRSDGTPLGTIRLGAITPDNFNDFHNTAHYTFASIAGRLLFSNTDGISGQELWKIDDAGAVLMQDLAPGVLRSDPRDFTIAGQSIFFSATDGSSGRELWSLPLSIFLNRSFYAPAIYS